ncbi:MAG: hypothetical protein H6740_24275 [Alphaproteobacteria bacterium]|nr:hypothetical protein [Alphaproteobacteria bacterium]
MARARTSFHALLLLLLASLIPALFLLDFLVQRAGRETWMESELKVRLDGQEALYLATPLVEQPSALPGLSLAGEAELRGDTYPWEPTGFAGRFELRLSPELLGALEAGPRAEGFAASYSVRLLERPDGLGLPPIPCRGEVMIDERSAVAVLPKVLADFERLQLHLDLICTSAGPDLEWDSGDERTWTIEGSLRLRSGKRPG